MASNNVKNYYRNDKPNVQVYFVPKKFELVPTKAEQSAEHTVPRLSHHPVGYPLPMLNILLYKEVNIAFLFGNLFDKFS